MTNSDPGWRLADGSNSPGDAAREAGTANPGSNNQPQDEVPAVEIRYPKNIEAEARAYKLREQRRGRGRLFLEALIVVGIFANGAIAYRQSLAMLAANNNSIRALESTERAYLKALQSTERAYVTALQTTERAYVTLGSKSGEIAGFIDNPILGEKRIIVLHFATRDSVPPVISLFTPPPLITPPLSGKPDIEGSQGNAGNSGKPAERDLPAGAEHLEYIVSPWSQRELTEHIAERFLISGQFEYYDIFGVYHCQGFSTNYLPNIKQFVPVSEAPCAAEATTNDAAGKGNKEAGACE